MLPFHTTRRTRRALSLLLAILPLGATPALAEGNGRPIEWVVGYAPGGGSDAVARMLAEAMARTMNQSIIVSNKPGAGSNIAADYVARARNADNVVFTADSAVSAANPSLYRKLSYNAEKDFAPIGTVARFPLVLVVAPDAVPKDYKSFVEWVRSDPRNQTYGSAGTGSPHHLPMELFRKESGLPMKHVSYRGAAPAMTDIMGGQLPYMFVDTSSGGPYLSTGKVRAIGVASKERIKSLPDVPTLDEQGLKGFEAYVWQALVAPAAARPETIRMLSRHLVDALNSPAVQQKLTTLDIEAIPSTPDQLTALSRTERERWGNVIREANIQLE